MLGRGMKDQEVLCEVEVIERRMPYEKGRCKQVLILGIPPGGDVVAWYKIDASSRRQRSTRMIGRLVCSQFEYHGEGNLE